MLHPVTVYRAMAPLNACGVLAFCMLVMLMPASKAWAGADPEQVGGDSEEAQIHRVHHVEHFLKIPICPDGGAAPVGLAYFIDDPMVPVEALPEWWGQTASSFDVTAVERVTYRVGRYEITQLSSPGWKQILLLDGRPWFASGFHAGLEGVVWMRPDGALVPFTGQNADGYPVAIVRHQPLHFDEADFVAFVALELLPRIIGEVVSAYSVDFYCREDGTLGLQIHSTLGQIAHVRNQWKGELVYRVYHSGDRWVLETVLPETLPPSDTELRLRARQVRLEMIDLQGDGMSVEGPYPADIAEGRYYPSYWNFSLYEEMIHLLLRGHRREAGLFLDWAWPDGWPGKGEFLMDVVQRVRRFRENPLGV